MSIKKAKPTDQFSVTFLPLEDQKTLAKEIKQGKSLQAVADIIGVDSTFLAEASLNIVRYYKYAKQKPSSAIVQLEKALEEYDKDL